MIVAQNFICIFYVFQIALKDMAGYDDYTVDFLKLFQTHQNWFTLFQIGLQLSKLFLSQIDSF